MRSKSDIMNDIDHVGGICWGLLQSEKIILETIDDPDLKKRILNKIRKIRNEQDARRQKLWDELNALE